jgi:hypothetical protein
VAGGRSALFQQSGWVRKLFSGAITIPYLQLPGVFADASFWHDRERDLKEKRKIAEEGTSGKWLS